MWNPISITQLLYALFSKFNPCLNECRNSQWTKLVFNPSWFFFFPSWSTSLLTQLFIPIQWRRLGIICPLGKFGNVWWHILLSQRGWWYHLHVGSRSQACHQTGYNAQDSPTIKIFSPKYSVSERKFYHVNVYFMITRAFYQ